MWKSFILRDLNYLHVNLQLLFIRGNNNNNQQ